MAVWKSSPNGKSEPVSRQNNSLLGNLNGSELTFVSCQVQSKGGGCPQQRSITKCASFEPNWNCWTILFLCDKIMYLSASSAHAHASAVICYGSCTVDLIQERTHTLWPWEDRWSRKEWTVLPQLARVLTLSWPHSVSLLLFLSASPRDDISFCAGSFFRGVSLRIAVFTWCHAVSLFCPSPVCAMAVRNCLECQQAQFKQGKEGTAHTYTALPANALGTSKSASAQASHPSFPPPPQHISFMVCFNCLNENVRLNSFTFWTYR